MFERAKCQKIKATKKNWVKKIGAMGNTKKFPA
jgi:hypothetical protein